MIIGDEREPQNETLGRDEQTVAADRLPVSLEPRVDVRIRDRPELQGAEFPERLALLETAAPI